MKKIIKSALLLLCGVVLFTACETDNDSNPTLLQPTTFTLNTPAYSSALIDLSRATGIPFTWSQPAYGFPVEAEYQLEASKDGNFTVNLKDVDEEHQTDANFISLAAYYNTPEGAIDPVALNNALNQMNGWNEDNPAPESTTVYVRASATTKGAPVIYSNVVTVNVSPTMEVVATYPEFIYEIGNESGWSTVHPLALNGEGTYQAYIYLDGAFKFRPNEGDWEGDWGQDPAGAYGTLVVDGEEDCNKAEGSFPDNVFEAGFFQVDVNTVDLTWSVTKVESVSIIGDFNGWGGDVDMEYNVSEGCWEATTTVTDGGLKFRMNHDWAVSWGLRDAGNPDLNDLTQNSGANIPVAAGTYKFQLYLSYEGNNRVVITAQ